jgi:hypothetical protein
MASSGQTDGRSAALGDASAQRIEEHRDAKGSIRLWQCAPHVYATRVVGHLSVELARTIIVYVDPLFAKGRVLGFHDWFKMTGYDSASRHELTAWSLRNKTLAQINVGTRSRIVNMGVSVASLALGENVIRQFSDEAALEAACREALAG